jgi:hypothetical protein
MPELVIANIVRQRLMETRRVRTTQLCRNCGEEILVVKTSLGNLVFLDMELRKHTCPKRRNNTGGNNK